MEENQNNLIPAIPAKTYKIEVTSDDAKNGCKKTVRYTRKTADGGDETVRLSVEIPAGTKDKEVVFVSSEGDWNETAGKKNAAVLVVKITGSASEDSETEIKNKNEMPEKVESITEDFEIKGSTLVKYNGTAKDVVIPEGITKIGKDAFKGNESIVSVRIPSFIESMGWSVFENCPNLVSVTIEAELASIDSYMFAKCVSLKEVSLPSSINCFKNGAFNGCKSLKNIALPKDLRLESNALKNCGLGKDLKYQGQGWKIENSLLIYDADNWGKSRVEYCTDAGATEIAIPEGIEKICYYAFSDYKQLKKLSIPKSVKEIGEKAFKNCALESDFKFESEDGKYRIENSVFIRQTGLIPRPLGRK